MARQRSAANPHRPVHAAALTSELGEMLLQDLLAASMLVAGARDRASGAEDHDAAEWLEQARAALQEDVVRLRTLIATRPACAVPAPDEPPRGLNARAARAR